MRLAVISIASLELVRWNRSTTLTYSEPVELVDKLIGKLGFTLSQIEAVERQRLLSREIEKRLDLQLHSPDRRLVEPTGAPFNSRYADAGNLGRPDDAWHWQSGALEVIDRHVARPGAIGRACYHGDPDQTERRQSAGRYNESRPPLLRQSIGVGKRNRHDIERIVA